ncbi:MAG: hypothetical protein FNT15_09910 [Sulfurovum sp.]|nr:MAG: hypothetical protein FNT15_09910 [Sulfurovum sp.]
MKKLALSLLAIGFLVSTASAEQFSARTGDKGAFHTEQEASKGSSVNVKNSTITNKSDIKDSAVAGNTGVQVQGKKVNIKNSTLDNKSTIKNSAVHGNTGIKVKGEKVDISNSTIKNKSDIKNSAVAGNTGVKLGE